MGKASKVLGLAAASALMSGPFALFGAAAFVQPAYVELNAANFQK